ncbi:ABC transporter substrate-binding protein [Hydrocarboniclastica marina]|uniref:Sulfonate ABC transporter substrate-binding protein n=1 Tax=Hydrocarboniclastica marina TaxID=2259620 RepID=A0A4P7XJC5_9ALTE|nr:ABC transporter substrate-binding protein [Hydrocarboniclastica marina]MAL99220.1 sulfonate ABC transporter substrate-binding protein [Alteromonadaceae bacterium]QCF25967.1 sulfonate ABC transporter substrate-binding protein [Hydrocarboniclastica marina]
MKLFRVAAGMVALSLSGVGVAQTIDVRIGHQSTVTNTVSGGIVLEKLELLQKHLPKDGKYADTDYNISYSDYTSGPPITNQMIAGRLEFGVMGDYPLITNGAAFQKAGKTETRLIAITGYNLKGTGNGIVVPIDSPVQSLEELKGKQISTPFGSAAWGMTLQVLADKGLSESIQLRDQGPPVGVANIAGGRIDAHADFTPWSEVMEFRGTGRKIFDGSEADIPTFHGTVVRKEFADEHPEVVQGVINATLEAQAWIQEDPMRAAMKVSEWTGIEKEVLYLYLSNGGITTQDASIKPQWVASLKESHALLQRERNVPDLDFERWVDDQFVRKAYEKNGVDYDEQVAEVVTPKANNADLAQAEIWFKDEGVSEYDTIAAMFEARKKAEADGKEINATYVYDHSTGLKLFGKAAFMVENSGGNLVAFMKKADADTYASTNGGSLIAGLGQ